MNNNQYLIPANSKKSQLIFGLFTGFDLVVFGIGLTFTIIMFLVIQSNNIAVVIGILSPALITGLLVMPVPNYHNVMTLISNIWKYFTGRRKYYWRGWCISDETRNEKH